MSVNQGSLVAVFMTVLCGCDPFEIRRDRQALDVTYANGVYVAVGGGVEDDTTSSWILASRDGASWRDVSAGDALLRSITHDGERFLAVGSTLRLDGDEPRERGQIWVSSSGDVWSQLDSVEGLGAPGAVAFGEGVYVVARVDGTLAVSEDGRLWETTSELDLMTVYGLVFEAGRFFAFGDGSVVASSADGRTWEQAQLPLEAVFSVERESDRFTATATRESSSLVYSSADGARWAEETRDATPPAFLDRERSPDGSVVGIATSRIYRRDQESGWDWRVVHREPRGVFFAALATSGSRVVAAGSTLVFSDDGERWLSANVPP